MEGSIVRGVRRRVVCKENGCPARGLGENSFFTLYLTYKNRKILVVSLSLPILPLSLKRGRKPQSRVLIRHSLEKSPATASSPHLHLRFAIKSNELQPPVQRPTSCVDDSIELSCIDQCTYI
jgi:hypothetical protein